MQEQVEEPAEEQVEEPVAEPAPADEFVEDPSLGPVVDLTLPKEEEDELPEIHAANEKDDDFFASKEGSQGNFFRLKWLMDDDPFGVGMR